MKGRVTAYLRLRPQRRKAPQIDCIGSGTPGVAWQFSQSIWPHDVEVSKLTLINSFARRPTDSINHFSQK